MTKSQVRKPTDAELAVLSVLWKRGPSTVRDVHDIITEERPLAYTTTLKVLQVMTDKGLSVREERGRIHFYTARHGETETQRRLVDDLLDRAFGGSAAKLVIQALATKRASAEEIAEIRRLLAAAARKEKR